MKRSSSGSPRPRAANYSGADEASRHPCRLIASAAVAAHAADYRAPLTGDGAPDLDGQLPLTDKAKAAGASCVSDTFEPADLETLRRDLMSWLFEADPVACASKSIGGIIIEITNALGIVPPYGPEQPAEWEDAVRERWAPLDQAWGFSPSGPPPDHEPYRGPAFDFSWAQPDALVPV